MTASLQDLIYKNDYKVPKRDPSKGLLKLEKLEIWYPEDPKNILAGPPPEVESLPLDEARNWIHRDAPSSTTGGLRLVILRHAQHDDETLKMMADVLGLPKTYLFDYEHYYPIATRLQEITIDGKPPCTLIVCQSPRFSQNFMSFALMYDPSSNIATGFLGYEHPEPGDYPLIKNLIASARHFPHPILLPVLALHFWCLYFQSELGYIYTELRRIFEDIGKLDDFLRQQGGKAGDPVQMPKHKMNDGDSSTEEEKPNSGHGNIKTYSEIHGSLLELHLHLSNSTSGFVANLSKSVPIALDDLKSTSLMGNGICDQELRAHAQQIQSMVGAKILDKEKLRSRVDTQLKVLYALMQQNGNDNNFNIAVESKKDSASMYNISVVTMAFLPPTTIATIFSMSPFFSASPGFTVSKQFWIYWAIVIPLTTAVMVMWSFSQWRRHKTPKLDLEKNNCSSDSLASSDESAGGHAE